MNARLRKVTRNRGQFPSEQAALKVLYLSVRKGRTAREIYDQMTERYPDRSYPGALWASALQLAD